MTIHRKPLIAVFLISIILLAFFCNQYMLFERSNAPIIEYPNLYVTTSKSGVTNNTQNFNLYGSSMLLSEYSNVSYNIPSFLSKNVSLKVYLSIIIYRMFQHKSPLIVLNLTYAGNNTFNTTKFDIGTGNYGITSTLIFQLNCKNKTIADEVTNYVSSSLKVSSFVNVNENTYPYLLIIPIYVSLVSTIILFLVTMALLKNAYDIRRKK
jgi:hypothetical protein